MDNRQERSLVPVSRSSMIKPAKLNLITPKISQAKRETKTEFRFGDIKVVQKVTENIVFDREGQPKYCESKRTFKKYKKSTNLKIKDETYNKNKLLSNENIKEKKPKSNNTINWKFVLLISFVLSFLLYYIFSYYNSTNRQCHFHYSIPLIKSNLENHIFGQKEAIDSIINSLDEFRFNYYTNSLIFVFTGTTGVGKSYTARILSGFFKNADYYCTNNHELPTYITYSDCDNEKIIVVDDIDNSTVISTINWLQAILKTEPKTKTLFILIINLKNYVNYDPSSIQESLPENQKNIKNQFGQIQIPNINFIDFQLLSRNSVIECINDAAKRFYQKGNLTDEEIEEILNRLPEQNCKRIYSQVEYLLANV